MALGVSINPMNAFGKATGIIAGGIGSARSALANQASNAWNWLQKDQVPVTSMLGMAPSQNMFQSLTGGGVIPQMGYNSVANGIRSINAFQAPKYNTSASVPSGYQFTQQGQHAYPVPTSPTANMPMQNAGATADLIAQIRAALQTLNNDQYVRPAQRALESQTNVMNARNAYYDKLMASNAGDTNLRKQKIDQDIYQAQRQMGRQGELRQNAMAQQADYIANQTNLTNSQIGDLNLQAAGQARNIAYQNALLEQAFAALGLDKQDYINVQNLINSRQQNLNTVTNLNNENTNVEFANRKRDTYDDTVARGALSSVGAQADLADVDKQFALAKDKLREDLRMGTSENQYARSSADTNWARSENSYKTNELGIREQQAQSADQIKLYESEGSRIRSTYGYNVNTAQREMSNADINYRTSIDALQTNINQWGIDKQLLDSQLKQQFDQMGLTKQMEMFDYMDKAYALTDAQKAAYNATLLQVLQYTPVIQQNPGLYAQIAASLNSGGSATSSLRAATGSN